MKKITLLLCCLFTVAFSSAQLNGVALVGSGAGGWPGDPGYPAVDLNQMTTSDNVQWSLSDVTINGNVKFRGNNSWDSPYNWGTPTFPTGTAIVNDSGAFTVPEGIYDVTFNSNSLEYTFVLSSLYPLISIIGTAVSGTEVYDVDYDLGTTDGVMYSATGVHLYPGVVKWRQGHIWTETTHWGPENPYDFFGTAVLGSISEVIISVEGFYNVTFNLNTLAYTFTFSKVAIVGSATTAGWPSNEPGEIDPLYLSTMDGLHYTMSSIFLTAGSEMAFKFRADNSWNNQWGSSTDPGFPSGIGTQGGTDIFPDVTGIYSLSFNRETGIYLFTVLGVEDYRHSDLKAYPNPTRNDWNFSSTTDVISSIRITDCTGKIIMDLASNSVEATINAAGLSKGIYFAKVSTTSGSQTMKVVKQ